MKSILRIAVALVAVLIMSTGSAFGTSLERPAPHLPGVLGAEIVALTFNLAQAEPEPPLDFGLLMAYRGDWVQLAAYDVGALRNLFDLGFDLPLFIAGGLSGGDGTAGGGIRGDLKIADNASLSGGLFFQWADGQRGLLASPVLGITIKG